MRKLEDSASYCTNLASQIDIEELFEGPYMQATRSTFVMLIIGLNGLLVLFTLTQFCCHYSMIMQWYKKNPIDGLSVARKISVGIPVEKPNMSESNQEESNQSDSAVTKGLTVPEADREVISRP